YDDPSDLGLLPDGADQESASDGRPEPAGARQGPLETASWRAALGSWPFWQLAGAYGVCGFTTAILTTHFIPYALDRGFTASTAAAAFGLMSGLNVAGVIAGGGLAGRWGGEKRP